MKSKTGLATLRVRHVGPEHRGTPEMWPHKVCPLMCLTHDSRPDQPRHLLLLTTQPVTLHVLLPSDSQVRRSCLPERDSPRNNKKAHILHDRLIFYFLSPGFCMSSPSWPVCVLLRDDSDFTSWVTPGTTLVQSQHQVGRGQLWLPQGARWGGRGGRTHLSMLHSL